MRRAASIGFLSSATLLSEVIFTRVLSVSHIYSFAFLAVSIAILGQAMAARILARSHRTVDDSSLAKFALAFSFALVAAHSLSQSLGFDPIGLHSGVTAWLRLFLFVALLLIPYLCSGLAITGLLAKAESTQVRKLYGADLLGAAVGCWLALLCLPVLGPSSLYVGAALSSVAAALLAYPRLGLFTATLSLAASFFFPLPVHIVASKTTQNGMPFQTVFSNPRLTLSTQWSTHARIDHVRFARGVHRLILDAGVAAVRIPPQKPPPGPAPKTDATLPYELRPGGRFLIVGSGAGWEIGEAVLHGASEVLGVEIHPVILDKTPQYLRNASEVQLLCIDARSIIETAPSNAYDGVIMIHTISNAAAAGALGLTEDHLLTQEAFRSILRILKEDGLLFVTRPIAQLDRLEHTVRSVASSLVAVKRWRERQSRFYGALLVKQAPWTEQELARIEARVKGRGLVFEGKAELDDSTWIATDDRPFFHRRSVVDTYDPNLPLRAALEEWPIAELSLLALLVVSSLLCLLLLPFGKIGLRINAPFFCTGLAFMLLEVSLSQRLSLLVGAPTISVALTLGGLLVGAGYGSWGIGTRLASLAALRAMAVCLAWALLGSWVVHLGLPLPSWARWLQAGSLALLTGLFLGPVLPALLGSVNSQERASGLALNGAASVLGTSVALLLAPLLGLGGVALLAAALYGTVRLLRA